MAQARTSQSATLKKHRSWKSRILRGIGLLIPVALMYWIFVIKIPSQVSYAEVWQTIEALTLGQNLTLLVAGLLTILSYGWTSATVLPGLSLRLGTQSAVTGQLTSVVLPAPMDLVIRFGMYKSYGFSIDKSAVAVGVAGIARYFTVVAIPLLGLYALIVGGQANSREWLAAAGVTLLMLFALWAMRQILSSQKSAAKVGELIQNIANRVLRLLRRNPRATIATSVVEFGARTRDVAIKYFRPIAISNIVWGLSCYLVLLLAIRFCGIGAETFSSAYILLIAGVMLFLNAFPITPGGIGVTETILMAIIPFPDAQTQTEFVSALFLYRIYSWLLPMPVGAAAYLNWKRQYKGKLKTS